MLGHGADLHPQVPVDAQGRREALRDLIDAEPVHPPRRQGRQGQDDPGGREERSQVSQQFFPPPLRAPEGQVQGSHGQIEHGLDPVPRRQCEGDAGERKIPEPLPFYGGREEVKAAGREEPVGRVAADVDAGAHEDVHDGEEQRHEAAGAEGKE